MAFSTSRTPTPDAAAISFSDVARPPRVGSRSTCRSGVTASIAATSGCSAAVSLVISEPNSSPSRTLMIAMPCTPMAPLTMTTSPGRARSGRMSTPDRHQPDARGVHVDLVAVTGVDHLGVAGDDRDPGGARGRTHVARHSADEPSSVPSSSTNPHDRCAGVAPLIARSLTVPLTARCPIEPPGKNSGRTTNVSVEKAIRAPPSSHTAESARPARA